MTGWLLVLLGVLLVVVGVAWMFGPWVLVAAGVVVIGSGLFVDFDPKESQRAKRDSAAP